MARSLNIVIGADIEKLRKGLQEAIVAIQSSGSKMSAETAKAATEIEKKLAAISTKNPTAGTVRQLTNLAMEARALGPEFQNVANDIIRQAGKIKDSIGDARAEVSYFASDTRRLDAAIGTVQAVAGAYSVVEGATALLGVESENLQKTMVKLQAVMAVVTGLQEIQTLLQEESAAMQGLLALRTTVLTAAQTAYASAVGTATGVQRAFNLAMAAAPWALAATALAAIVIAVGNYQERIKKAAEQQKLFNEINSETQKNFEEEVKSVSGLLAVVNNHNASMRERKNALAEIQKIYPDFLANQSLDKASSEELKIATSNLTNEIYKQAKAKAAFTKLQELSAKMLEYELGKQQAQLSTQAEINRLYASGASPAQVQKFIESQKNVGTIAEQNAAKIQSQIDAIINMSNAQGLSITPVTKNTKAIQEQNKAIKKNAEELKKENEEIKKSAEETAKVQASFIEWLEKKRFESGEKAKKKAIQDSKALTAANLQAGTAATPVYLDVKINPVSYSKAAKDIQKMTDSLNQAFAQLQTEAAVSFGEFLGNLASGDREAGKNFGKNMLGAVAAFMDSLGKALIATAIASQAFQKLVLTNPVAAAAAGIALIAGATMVRNSLKEGPKVTAFAEGGIVSGPTLGLVGEYPNARNNPEVIAPLDKLKGMLKTGDSSSGFVASTTIQGRDLAIVLERYNKDSKRG